MKFLAWNIRHGGGKRVERIVEEVSAYDAEVIALTEFRSGPGEALRAAFAERGWRYCETTAPAAGENGIAVFSTTPIERLRPCPISEYAVRWLEVGVPAFGVAVAVLHIMAAGSSKSHPLNIAKARFWDAVVEAARARSDEPLLLAGDWNTGAHFQDENGKTYVCSEQFGELSRLGWVDLWRRFNPGPTEWTWYSTLKGGVRGNGFRLDHAFASPALADRIHGCRYSHAEREAGISDHSVVVVEIM